MFEPVLGFIISATVQYEYIKAAFGEEELVGGVHDLLAAEIPEVGGDEGVVDLDFPGLDIDALKIVSQGVNALRDENRAFLVITHYQRLLEHIVPDTVHVLYRGRIIQSGDKSLAHHLEENGYAEVIASAA